MPDMTALRPLTTELPPIVILSSLDFGGAGIAALRLHQGLLAAGADVKMVVLRKESAEVTVGELKTGGAPMWNQAEADLMQDLRDYPARSPWQEAFTSVAAPFNVAELDLVQSAGLVNLHWCAGMLPWPQAGANLRGKPLVWTLHDMNPFTGGCHYAGDCERWRQGGCRECPQLGPDASGGDLAAANFKAKWDGYAGLALHVVTPSKWLGECASQSILFGKFPRALIPYGFPLDELRPLDRAAARAALGLPPNRKIILFGAQSCAFRRKGLHLLTAALPRLAEQWHGEPPTLAVFGTPEGLPPLPNGFNYHTLGRLNGNEELSRAYSAADVFVLPSLEDNLPNTIIEAQACGTPCVGFAIGGVPDIVASPSLGRLAQPFDTNDLADKILEVLQAGPEETAATRQKCREHAESAYNQYAQTAAYLWLYRHRLGLPEVVPAPASPNGRFVPPAIVPPAATAPDFAPAALSAAATATKLTDGAQHEDDGPAPIVLIAYNRLELTQKTVAALQANPEAAQSDLYVFADGAKPGQEASVNALRDYLRSLDGFRSVRLTCRESNMGLSANVLDGVTRVIGARGRAIVVEDDILTSPHFLRYMNEALTMYADTPEVACISGYAYPVKEEMPDSYFIRGAACWGWGTWRRAWKLFIPRAEALYDAIVSRNLENDFDFGGCYPYTHMLTSKSWDVLWMASAFLENKLCLFPGRSLVNNLGFGEGATNCEVTCEEAPYQTAVAGEPIPLQKIAPQENPENRRIVGEYLRWANNALVYANNFERLTGAQVLQALPKYVFAHNDYHQAIFILNKLIERGDGDLENVHAMRGFSRWQLGDRAGGEADAREELRRYPNNKLANDFLGLIKYEAGKEAAMTATRPLVADEFAPIVLFAYNRRDLVEKTVNALKANPEAAQSDLYIFADGAKPGQEEKVNAVREYLRSVNGFRSVHLTCRESNLGLAPNVIDGVTAVINVHGRVIVMEDDLVTSPHYLRYMNEALKMYANTPEVVCISGYAFPVKATMPETYFIRGTCCWGWATWKRGWELFNPDSEALYNAIVARNATHDFDFDGCYPYTWALKQNNKLLWAVRWMASAYVQNKLCLFPGRSLVDNIGFGNDATNCHVGSDGNPYQTEVTQEPIQLQRIAPIENPVHRRAIGKFLRWTVIVLAYAYKYERMPGDYVLQATIARIQARNEYDAASFFLDKLIQRGDGNLENVYALRGFSRWQLGDRAGGEADIREELRRHPNNLVALDLLRQISNEMNHGSPMTVANGSHSPVADGFAPIALFAYNRRDLVEKTVNALKANPEAAQSDLYIFADGAKPGQEEKVNAVREYLRSVSGFRSIHLTCRESNLGLAPNVIDGVTAVVNAHGRIIVMEDDLITSPHYLRYMNEALKMYANTPEVVCISGYAFPVKATMPETYFIRGTCCWGWATWKRGWELFNPDSEALYNAIVARNATRDFDFDGCYPYTNMLKNNKNSWAIRWMASAFVKNKLCLFPGRSLVNNIGFGEGATNLNVTSNDAPYQTEVAQEPIALQAIAPGENPGHRQAVGEYLRWAYHAVVYAAHFQWMPGAQVLQALPKCVLAPGDYHLAAFILDKLIERGDGNLDNIYALRGFSRYQIGDRAGGEADVREELRRHPGNPMALDLLRQMEGGA